MLRVFVCKLVLCGLLAMVTPCANANYIYEILPVELPDGLRIFRRCCPQETWSTAITGGFIETNINDGRLSEGNIVAYQVGFNDDSINPIESVYFEEEHVSAYGISITPTSIFIRGDEPAGLEIGGSDCWEPNDSCVQEHSVSWGYDSSDTNFGRIHHKIDYFSPFGGGFIRYAERITGLPIEIARIVPEPNTLVLFVAGCGIVFRRTRSGAAHGRLVLRPTTRLQNSSDLLTPGYLPHVLK